MEWVYVFGGEGGIRTLDTLRYTRFRVVRIQPDSATSPFFTFNMIKVGFPAEGWRVLGNGICPLLTFLNIPHSDVRNSTIK